MYLNIHALFPEGVSRANKRHYSPWVKRIDRKCQNDPLFSIKNNFLMSPRESF